MKKKRGGGRGGAQKKEHFLGSPPLPHGVQELESKYEEEEAVGEERGEGESWDERYLHEADSSSEGGVSSVEIFLPRLERREDLRDEGLERFRRRRFRLR